MACVIAVPLKVTVVMLSEWESDAVTTSSRLFPAGTVKSESVFTFAPNEVAAVPS